MRCRLRLFTMTILLGTAACADPKSASGPSPGTGIVVRFDAPFSDPGDDMAKSLAMTENISVEAAKQRLALQHEVSVLSERMRARYGDQFVGAAIERTPAYGIKFYVTGVDIDDVKARLPELGASAAMQALARIERVEKTQAQMSAQAVRMQRQLEKEGIDASVAFSPATFKIETLHVDETREALRAGRVEGGDAVVIEQSPPVRIIVD